MTVSTIREHIQMMRAAGQDEYAEYARRWYFELLGQYLT